MKYPAINSRPAQAVNIPDFLGGVNKRDAEANILDNQLTDCLNVWEHNGNLCTRNAFESISTKDKSESESGQIVNVTPHPEIIIDGKMLVCVQVNEDKTEDGEVKHHLKYLFWLVGNTDVEDVDVLDTIVNFPISSDAAKQPLLLAQKGTKIYAYARNSKVYYIDVRGASNVWSIVENLYIPTTIIHAVSDMNGGIKATQFESINKLKPYAEKQIYSSVNLSLVQGGETQDMRYYLVNGQQFKASDTGTITVKYTSFDVQDDVIKGRRTVIHTATKGRGSADAIWESTSTKPEDNLKIKFDGNCLEFYFWNSGSTPTIGKLAEIDYIEDNMEITINIDRGVPYGDSMESIAQMTQAVWFGGGALGISGGTRLFLGGSKNPGDENLVMWSGLNDPTYFPENNYARIGSNNEPVTAFGKQSNYLIVFKKNSVYYTQYMQNENITADDLINQSVIDYQAASVYFPMVLINNSIGCDCPNTVQLCRNRLVWATSSGNIYTLVTNNQYSEKNIYEVGAMIKSEVVGKDITVSTSADYNGYYCLFVGNKAYAMSYNSYGYQYVSSYSKNEDAQLKIPWYIWEFYVPDDSTHFEKIVGFGDTIIGTTYFHNESGTDTMRFGFRKLSGNTANDEYFANGGNGISTQTADIKSMAQSKAFDFGSPHMRKKISRVAVQVGENEAEPITVSLICDSESEEFEVIPDEPISNSMLIPSIVGARFVKVKFETFGLLFNYGMNILYKILGGAKK